MRALLAALLVAATPGVHHTAAGTAAARTALLRHGDLGAGWVAGATPKKVGTLSCAASTAPKGVVETGAAVSPTYRSSSDGPFVSQSVYVYSSETGAATLFTRVAGHAALTCLAESFVGGDPNGKVAFTATAQRTLHAPGVEGRAAAYRVVGRATVSAQKVTVYVDLVLIQRGDAISALSYASFSAPVAASLEARIARAASARL